MFREINVVIRDAHGLGHVGGAFLVNGQHFESLDGARIHFCVFAQFAQALLQNRTAAFRLPNPGQFVLVGPIGEGGNSPLLSPFGVPLSEIAHAVLGDADDPRSKPATVSVVFAGAILPNESQKCLLGDVGGIGLAQTDTSGKCHNDRTVPGVEFAPGLVIGLFEQPLQ